MRWEIAEPFAGAEALAREIRAGRLAAQILHNRGMDDPVAAAGFLEPKLSDLHDPELLSGAVEVARIARRRGWGRLVVVTDRFHLPRALFLFRRLGLSVTGDPVRGRGGGSRRHWMGAAVREVPAWVKNRGLVAAGRHRRDVRP